MLHLKINKFKVRLEILNLQLQRQASMISFILPVLTRGTLSNIYRHSIDTQVMTSQRSNTTALEINLIPENRVQGEDGAVQKQLNSKGCNPSLASTRSSSLRISFQL